MQRRDPLNPNRAGNPNAETLGGTDVGLSHPGDIDHMDLSRDTMGSGLIETEPSMASRLRAFDWSRTALGPMTHWPQSLRTAVDICLSNRFPMMVWWGPELINIYNDAYAPMLGKRHPQALGLPGREAWAELWPTLAPQIETVMQRGESTWNDRMHLVVERNGYPEDTWFTWSYSPIHDESGKVAGLFNACREDTRQVLAERERDRLAVLQRSSADQARTILESITDAFFALDHDWKFTYINPQAERTLSRAPGELLGRVLWEEYPGLRGSDFDSCCQTAMTHRISNAFSAYYPDHQRFYEVHCYPSGDGIAVYFRDVSAQKRIETERQEFAQRFAEQSRRVDRMLSSITDFTYSFDLNGRFTFASKPLLDLWGLSLQEAVGKNFFDLSYPDDLAARLQRQIQQVVDTKDIVVDETAYVSPSGVGGYFQYIFSPVIDENGSVEAVAGSTRDVTKSRLLEAAAKCAADRIAFVVLLTDALRPLADPVAIQAEAARLLGRHLQVNRVHYGEVTQDGEYAIIQDDYYDGLPSVAGKHHLSDYGPVVDALRAGMTLIVPDVQSDLRMSQAHRAAHVAISVAAYVSVPLVKEGRLAAMLVVHQSAPRAWTEDEITLVEETAERTWAAVERARAETALRASEASFRQLADAMPQIVWAAGPDGKVDYYNRRWFEYINVNPESIAEAAWENYIHPDDLPRTFADWEQAVKLGKPYSIEFRVRSAGGEYCWYLVRALPEHDRHGQVVRWFGTCTDIEDRRRDQAHDRFLLALETAVRPLSDPAEITATHARLLGEHLHVDRCAYADVEADEDTFNLTGDYNRGVPSIVGRYRFVDFGEEVLRLMRADKPYVAHDVDSFQPPIADLSAYRATMIQAVICVPLHKDGCFVAAMAVHQKVPRAWSAQEVELVRHIAGRCWESIERARVERALRESEARLLLAKEGAALGIHDLNIITGEISWDERVREIWGLDADEKITYDLFLSCLNPDDRASTDAAIEASIDPMGDGRYFAEYRVRSRTDGIERWVAAVGQVSFRLGKAMRLVGTVQDITERKTAEVERQSLLESERLARSEAEHASRMKDEFLATLSHELRTPLSAILGWSHLLRRPGAKPDTIGQGLETIERNARAQTQIIDDLLDMSRIISGKISLDVRPANLSAIVRAAIDTVSAAASAKAIPIFFNQPVHARHPIIGDVNRLQQVFWNLFSNAIKFTTAGVVEIRIEQNDSQWQVDVTDTGEGIPGAFLPFVFDRFRQADATTTRKHGGLGLGLAIVKQLIELHGGSVGVKSDGPGKGSNFTVMLPINIAAENNALGDQPSNPEAGLNSSNSFVAVRDGVPWDVSLCEEIRGIKVLVVDDEADARGLLKQLLEDCGAQAFVAATADEAVAMLEMHRPDVLVSDIGMPVEDGYSLLSRIRLLGIERGGAIPAIALTAYARAEDRMKAVRAGFQMHVPKPVEPAELLAMVASLVSRHPARKD